MKITYSESVADTILKDIQLPLGMKPNDVGGIINGKIYGKDICSIIEMSDEINKIKER